MPGFSWGDRLPLLESERLRLRRIELRDAPAMFDVFGDPEVMRYWSRPPFESVEQIAEHIEEIGENFHSRTLFQWGITRSDEDRVIGTCTLYRLDEAHRRGEIGFAVGRSEWGRGVASEAVGALLEFAFRALDLHRIEADADPRNERSIRLLERQGFQREGVLRARYFVGDEIQDALVLGLLRPDWRGVRGSV